MAITRSQSKEKSTSDVSNIILLIILYLLQGVPLGLSMGSIPFILKSKLGYKDLALFSLASYPYSLKLLWSPIVDSTFIKSIGRRKSWIVPIQALIGSILILYGLHIDQVLEQPEIPVYSLALFFTLLVFLCATQDIAVDGWAVSLLQNENKTFASTAQTIGLNTGYFLSFTVFLAFNSPEFSNKFLRSTPLDTGVLSLGSYLMFWGVMFLIVDAWLILFKSEEETREVIESVSSVYSTLYKIGQLKHVRDFTLVLLIAKIGFICNESVTGLKLLELGFSKEHLALAVLIDFPLQLVFGYYAAKWSSGPRPLNPWLIGYWGRLFAAGLAMAVIAGYPTQGVTSSYFTLVMTATVFSSFMSTIQFVSIGCFFAKISDPAIGGTYMTLLNTLSNLGGTWPKYFVLLAVDYFTNAPCSTGGKCTDEKSKTSCTSAGGSCSYISDGYYLVNTISIILGIVTLVFYVLPTVRRLEKLPDTVWRLKQKQ